MSPEAQRIAIAEVCGWRILVAYIGGDFTGFVWQAPNGEPIGTHWMNGSQVKTHGYSATPDYLNDLNAMHEAEKHLLKVHAKNYARHLGALVEVEYHEELALHRLITATAAQRAEAFLRTINRWDDSK